MSDTASDPTPDTAMDFAARAEERRLAGDAHAAIEIAESGLSREPGDLRGRVALALARIDLGDILQARDDLSEAIRRAESASASPETSSENRRLDDELDAGALGDDELETAFAQAETNPDEMMDANKVVEQTLRDAELDTPEPELVEVESLETPFDITSRPTYATESMAMLLAEQGRRAEAEALRESLGGNGFDATVEDDATLERMPPADAGAADWGEASFGPDHVKRLQVVATLEGWLHNLKRNTDRSPRAGGAA